MTKPAKLSEATQKSSTGISLIRSEMKQIAKLNSDMAAEYSVEQRKFVKNLINKDLTDTELLLFLRFSEKLKLNPFQKEIIAIVYHKDDPRRTVNTIVTRDGKMVVAQRTGELKAVVSDAIYVKEVKTPIFKANAEGKFVPSDEFLTETKKVEPWEGGKLWGATATVTRKTATFTATVPLAEYIGQNLWATKPATMIKKVATSQALTMAFPEILGSVYDETEMAVVDEPRTPAMIPGGEAPAEETQLEAIRSMGGETSEGMTKQQAADTIRELATKKAKKGVV